MTCLTRSRNHSLEAEDVSGWGRQTSKSWDWACTTLHRSQLYSATTHGFAFPACFRLMPLHQLQNGPQSWFWLRTDKELAPSFSALPPRGYGTTAARLTPDQIVWDKLSSLTSKQVAGIARANTEKRCCYPMNAWKVSMMSSSSLKARLLKGANIIRLVIGRGTSGRLLWWQNCCDGPKYPI